MRRCSSEILPHTGDISTTTQLALAASKATTVTSLFSHMCYVFLTTVTYLTTITLILQLRHCSSGTAICSLRKISPAGAFHRKHGRQAGGEVHSVPANPSQRRSVSACLRALSTLRMYERPIYLNYLYTNETAAAAVASWAVWLVLNPPDVTSTRPTAHLECKA